MKRENTEVAVVALILGSVFIYTVSMILMRWGASCDVKTLRGDAGTFGDSFGFVTCIFTGVSIWLLYRTLQSQNDSIWEERFFTALPLIENHATDELHLLTRDHEGNLIPPETFNDFAGWTKARVRELRLQIYKIRLTANQFLRGASPRKLLPRLVVTERDLFNHWNERFYWMPGALQATIKRDIGKIKNGIPIDKRGVVLCKNMISLLDEVDERRTQSVVLLLGSLRQLEDVLSHLDPRSVLSNELEVETIERLTDFEADLKSGCVFIHQTDPLESMLTEATDPHTLTDPETTPQPDELL